MRAFFLHRWDRVVEEGGAEGAELFWVIGDIEGVVWDSGLLIDELGHGLGAAGGRVDELDSGAEFLLDVGR